MEYMSVQVTMDKTFYSLKLKTLSQRKCNLMVIYFIFNNPEQTFVQVLCKLA